MAEAQDILVTVVIPCFNHGAYLWEAIRSVENSGFDRYEIIVVDDGSTDPLTQKVALEIRDAGYHILLQNNQGVAASRNNAIKLARGKYIIPLDADNCLLKPYFFEGVRILEENPKVGVVYGDAIIIGEKTGDWKNHPMEIREMLFENNIDTCAIIRRSMWEQVGGYDSKAPVPTRQDYIFWLDCIRNDWEFRHLPDYCFEYRFLDGSEVRKYSRISSKRLLITEYLYQRQQFLIARERGRKTLSEAEADRILGRLRAQLAIYHLHSGSIARGFTYLWGATIYPGHWPQILKTAISWPYRRYLS